MSVKLIFHHILLIISVDSFWWKREPNFPFSLIYLCKSTHSALFAYLSFTRVIHFSFSKWHLTLVTTYFSQTTSVVSQPNKQCCRMWQAMSPSFTSNPVRFCLQSPRVLSAKPTSIACNSHEYCKCCSRAVQVLLASRTSVAREPCKCRSWAMQVSLMPTAWQRTSCLCCVRVCVLQPLLSAVRLDV